jgi:hypothetical protein
MPLLQTYVILKGVSEPAFSSAGEPGSPGAPLLHGWE